MEEIGTFLYLLDGSFRCWFIMLVVFVAHFGSGQKKKKKMQKRNIFSFGDCAFNLSKKLLLDDEAHRTQLICPKSFLDLFDGDPSIVVAIRYKNWANSLHFREVVSWEQKREI